jgi:hypothetical protein
LSTASAADAAKSDVVLGKAQSVFTELTRDPMRNVGCYLDSVGVYVRRDGSKVPISDVGRKAVQKFSTASCETVAGHIGVRLSVSHRHLMEIRP